MYIALYHEEETPPLFFRYPPTPYRPRSSSCPGEAPALSHGISLPAGAVTGIDPTGRETAQKRHSSSRSPAAATKIFNDPLNLTGKENCPRRIAPHQPPPSTSPPPAHRPIHGLPCNSFEYLANTPLCSRFLMVSRVSSFSRVFYSPRLPLSLLSQ